MPAESAFVQHEPPELVTQTWGHATSDLALPRGQQIVHGTSMGPPDKPTSPHQIWGPQSRKICLYTPKSKIVGWWLCKNSQIIVTTMNCIKCPVNVVKLCAHGKTILNYSKDAQLPSTGSSRVRICNLLINMQQTTQTVVFCGDTPVKCLSMKNFVDISHWSTTFQSICKCPIDDINGQCFGH